MADQSEHDDLKARLRQHVQKRGGSNLNGAWRMVTDAADALDARDAEIARLRNQCDKLASGIAEAAQKAGIYNGEAPLDGPSLLMLLDNMANALQGGDDEG